ncbi:hypothetical protein, partial [Roseomonas sp. USHLN139]|uniref:hypothetical protein n=1 Tax=Roseomonas sp. USHLN139 TaxID=3081298 RepID=UPI003B024B25
MRDRQPAAGTDVRDAAAEAPALPLQTLHNDLGQFLQAASNEQQGSAEARAAASEKMDLATASMADGINASVFESAAHRAEFKMDEIERNRRDIEAIEARAAAVLREGSAGRQELHLILDTIIDLMPYAGEIGGPAEDA